MADQRKALLRTCAAVVLWEGVDRASQAIPNKDPILLSTESKEVDDKRISQLNTYIY